MHTGLGVPSRALSYFAGGTVTAVPSMHRWLQIVSATFHHLYNVNGPTDLAIGFRTSHDCETNTSVVIRN